MEQNTKLHIIIKIAVFLFVRWIFKFNRDSSKFSKSMHENCCISRRLYTRNYRSLAKYKKNKDSNNICLEEDIKSNKVNEQKDISYNKKKGKRTNKLTNKSLLNKSQYYTEVIDYNNGMFDGKHYHFEKKWIKKKDYDNFLEKKRRINDIALKKIKFRSYGFGAAIFFLFFLFGIGLPILRTFDFVDDSTFTPFKTCWEFIYKGLNLGEIKAGSSVPGVENFFLAVFLVLTIILAALIIVAIPKILRNNEKYKKLKYMS
ncbi:hypothetical protein MKS88_001751 [Plasmodium brasilianum]|uniref:Uncharacterized protein n=1 Tax=Plasmodium brasilianum TaxID=5824 RepID=A0ACB9YCB3_PLABR|nr:hypothetical protein MKS88_001751 [Plasmodium brasilianum]